MYDWKFYVQKIFLSTHKSQVNKFWIYKYSLKIDECKWSILSVQGLSSIILHDTHN